MKNFTKFLLNEAIIYDMNNDSTDPKPKKPDSTNSEAHSYDVLKKHLPLNHPVEHLESKDEHNRIEELKKHLYSKSMSGVNHIRRPGLQDHPSLVNESWSEEEEQTPKIEVFPNTGRRRIFLKRFFTFSIFLFILAMGYGVYEVYTGNNFISGSNIDVKITGPVTISSGDVLILDLDITNHNSSAIELVDLVMTYPDGTRLASDNTKPIINDRISIGTIEAGETKQKRIEVVLFGEEGTNKSISASLEYRVPGSTNIFKKQKEVSFAIGNSPVTLTIDSIGQITSGQDIVLTIGVKSNSTQLLRGILLKALYPFGFKFKSATPVPSSSNDTWNLGDISPNSEQKIQITGSITSDENQERNFKFNVGTVDPQDDNQIGTIFITNSRTLAVSQPFIGSDVTINGKSDKTVSVSAGQAVQAEVAWKNNLDVPINDVVISAKLSGGFLDRTSVLADPGFYKSEDNTIVWDRSNINSLGEVKAGESGRVLFTFNSFLPSKENVMSVRNPAITIDLTVHGSRLNENSVSEDIKSSVTKVVKIKSEMALKTSLVRSVGPFVNTGPFPTVAERSSTFTEIVKISNSYNTIKNPIYTAVLPNYVEWTGQVSPKTSVISYDPLTRTVTWKVGDISPGTGYSSPAKEVAFQVSFKPSISQIGTAPIVIKSQSVSGTDGFTGDPVQISDSPLDIRIESDPTYQYGQDHVISQ